MNEKIKELQKAAGIQVVRTLMREDENTEVKLMLTESQLEKFAELIVREFIRQNKSYAVNSTHRDFYLGWNDAITHCNESVKEYFGIEE